MFVFYHSKQEKQYQNTIKLYKNGKKLKIKTKPNPLKSQETLTWHPDTFFTGLLRENGVGIAYDRENSIFIDRDPHYFKVGYQILNNFMVFH